MPSVRAARIWFEHGDGVEKPDLVTYVRVFVVVGEVGVERVVVELDLRLGVGRRLPCLLR